MGKEDPWYAGDDVPPGPRAPFMAGHSSQPSSFSIDSLHPDTDHQQHVAYGVAHYGAQHEHDVGSDAASDGAFDPYDDAVQKQYGAVHSRLSTPDSDAAALHPGGHGSPTPFTDSRERPYRDSH
jgi:hypothetical protein